jgi:hypothetical protein
MNVTRFLALPVAALLSIAAIAEDQGDNNKAVRDAQQKFESLDRNEDSQISPKEARKDEKLTATFAAVDADGDGYLSKLEYTAQLHDKSPQQAADRSGY